jgi:FtsP/CotA-like multicopper oxidase with cupredoxin domain
MTRRALTVAAVAALVVSGSLVASALPPATAASTGDGGRYAHHPTPDGDATLETTLVENGSVVNANSDTAPGACETIRGERRVTIEAGRQYADAGEAFGYDLDRITAPPCTRLVVTVVNHDDVRHQWMVHDLPTSTYPMGMFTIEVADAGSVTAAFVTPAAGGEYAGHCSLPQHEQKGMRLPLVVTADSGTETTRPPGDGSSSGDVPGFGLLPSVAAAAVAALLVARR